MRLLRYGPPGREKPGLADKDGNALFPMMPYQHFRSMSDDDVYALVAYMNTLPPVRHAVPKMKVPFPLALLLKSAPKPLNGPVMPCRSAPARRPRR